MINPQHIVDEARSWVGTPFRHQARIKGLGVDCVGLLVGVGEVLGLEVYDQTGYGRQPYRRAGVAHGATVGPTGVTFLSIQKWTGAAPSHVTDDWEGATMGETHAQRIG